MIVACTAGGPATRGAEGEGPVRSGPPLVRNGKLAPPRTRVLGRAARARTFTGPREPVRGEKLLPPAAADFHAVETFGLEPMATDKAPESDQTTVAVTTATALRANRDRARIAWPLLTRPPGTRRSLEILLAGSREELATIWRAKGQGHEREETVAETRLSVTIARPVEDVLRVLTDPGKTPLWSAPAVEEHWITEGPVRVGSVRHAVTRFMGRRSENDAEVIEYVPNRGWTMKSVSGPPFVVSADFAPVDGGTRVDWTWSFDFRGPMKPIGPIVAWAFGRQFAKDLGRLKQMLEAGEL